MVNTVVGIVLASTRQPPNYMLLSHSALPSASMSSKLERRSSVFQPFLTLFDTCRKQEHVRSLLVPRNHHYVLGSRNFGRDLLLSRTAVGRNDDRLLIATLTYQLSLSVPDMLQFVPRHWIVLL